MEWYLWAAAASMLHVKLHGRYWHKGLDLCRACECLSGLFPSRAIPVGLGPEASPSGLMVKLDAVVFCRNTGCLFWSLRVPDHAVHARPWLVSAGAMQLCSQIGLLSASGSSLVQVFWCSQVSKLHLPHLTVTNRCVSARKGVERRLVGGTKRMCALKRNQPSGLWISKENKPWRTKW